MLTPIIGITCCYDESKRRVWLTDYYISAVVTAGGLPVIIPVVTPQDKIDQLINLCHGLLLPGGGDIDPLLFGELPHPSSGSICPQCDEFELALAERALRRNMPVLGICRGAQVINVAAGGTVCQDIALKIKDHLKHSQQAPRWYPTHTITAVAGSKLADMIGSDPVKVNSFHHQMIGRLGTGLKVAALAPDGVIEAIEHQQHHYFVLGVQYHPEALLERDPKAQALFENFIQAARRFMSKDYLI